MGHIILNPHCLFCGGDGECLSKFTWSGRPVNATCKEALPTLSLPVNTETGEKIVVKQEPGGDENVSMINLNLNETDHELESSVGATKKHLQEKEDHLVIDEQLKSFFILRKLLDLTGEKLEEYLRSNAGKMQPSSWFSLCGSCGGVVQECFELYRQINDLERRLQRKKSTLKELICVSHTTEIEKKKPGRRKAGETIYRDIRNAVEIDRTVGFRLGEAPGFTPKKELNCSFSSADNKPSLVNQRCKNTELLKRTKRARGKSRLPKRRHNTKRKLANDNVYSGSVEVSSCGQTDAVMISQDTDLKVQLPSFFQNKIQDVLQPMCSDLEEFIGDEFNQATPLEPPEDDITDFDWRPSRKRIPVKAKVKKKSKVELARKQKLSRGRRVKEVTIKTKKTTSTDVENAQTTEEVEIKDQENKATVPSLVTVTSTTEAHLRCPQTEIEVVLIQDQDSCNLDFDPSNSPVHESYDNDEDNDNWSLSKSPNEKQRQQKLQQKLKVKVDLEATDTGESDGEKIFKIPKKLGPKKKSVAEKGSNLKVSSDRKKTPKRIRFKKQKRVSGREEKEKCNLCPARFATTKSLIAHIKMHSDGKLEKCDVCDWFVPCLRKHERVMHRVRLDDINTLDEIAAIWGTAKIPFYCDHCHLIFPSHDKLRVHSSMSHKNKSLLACLYCDKHVESKQAIAIHYRIDHLDKLTETEDRSQFEFECFEEPRKCEHCTATFDSKLKMDYHIASEHQREQLKCKECKFIAKELNILNHHMSKHQQMPFDYVCEICSRMFKECTLLQNHRRADHFEELGLVHYKCDICGVVLARKKLLERHINYVHKKIKENFCEYCGKSFCWPRDLAQHLLLHTAPKEKQYKQGPFFCKFCDAKFNVRQGLYYHMKSLHNDKYVYRCENCGKGYFFKRTLYVHQMKCEGGSAVEESMEGKDNETSLVCVKDN